MDTVLAPITKALATLDALEQQLARVKSSDSGLGQLRADLETLQGDADKAADGVKPRMEDARVQRDKLGPPPKPGEPAESAQIVAERTRLDTIIATLDGALKSTDLIKVRARQSTARVQDLRHALFAENLLERAGSPLMPAIWRQIAAESGRASRQLDAVFGTWRGIVAARLPEAGAIAIGALFAYAVFLLIGRRVLGRFVPTAPARIPSFTARAAAATLAAPLYALPALAAVSVLYLGFDADNLIYSRVDALLGDIYQSSVLVIVVSALARAILEPRRASWRLMNLSDGAARSLWGNVRAIAVVYAVDVVLKEVIRLLVLPLPFNVALSFVTSLAFAALLIRVVLTPFEPGTAPSADAAPDDADRTPRAIPLTPPTRIPRFAPRWLKFPLLAVAIAIVAAALAGYVALSRFAAGQVVITGSAAVVVALLHLAIRTMERATASPTAIPGRLLAQGLAIGDDQRRVIGRGLSIVLHALLAVFTLPGVLLAWGFSVADVMSGVKSLFFGFQIGQLKISLFQILLALALFVGLLSATRLLQRWLKSGMLRPDRFDPGIANSIHQGVGYAGFALATLAAVSFGGIDITNLAIVAGALSVGIGFGLQSIVNNFVSGLILLVERPIKVGDWIVLRGGGEGYVRSISVRSTEIETFDRSSLIVPNSELISNVVTNWTHRNALGRVVVKVSASYKSDPDMVLRVLAEVAKASPNVMTQPAPLISLDNLGPDGLEFSVRVVVPDINRALLVQTQLRTGIFNAFRSHGIEFPTAERDIYLRDLDGVKVLVARVLEERARNQAQQAATVQATATEDAAKT